MAYSDETNNMVMPVQPMNYGMPYGGGMGGMGWGGDWGWIILLLLIAGNGWGGFGGMGGMGPMMGMMGAGMADGMALYPWMNQADITTSGFQNAATNSAISSLQNSVTSGFGDMQTALCGGFGNVQNALCQGFAGTNAAITGAQNALAQQMYANQLADLNRSFDAQSAVTAGMNAIQAQQANCCCENRAGIADLKYTVATENCADRTAAAQNTRDIIDAQTRGTQAIIDKLCALELDGVKNQLAQAQRENVGLQNQLNMATLRESQTAQNAFIAQGLANEVDALYNRLNTCPVPTTPVYGRTPIFTCNNGGCGCNGNGFANGLVG